VCDPEQLGAISLDHTIKNQNILPCHCVAIPTTAILTTSKKVNKNKSIPLVL
jgi:hypothetical protein